MSGPCDSKPLYPSKGHQSPMLKAINAEKESFDEFAKWKLVLDSPFVYSDYNLGAEQIAFVTKSAFSHTEDLDAVSSSSKKINWSDYCLPVAYNPGDPCELIAEASVDNFSILGIAFMENRLQMDNGMVPQKIVSLHLQESSVKEPESAAEKVHASDTPKEEMAASDNVEGTDVTHCASEENLADKVCNLHLESAAQCPEETVDVEEGGRMEDHHLHLSSCHECLELESCTIESVKYASAENIPDLPDDCSGVEEISEDERSQEKETKRADTSMKPPNVLLYVGSDPKLVESRFQQIKSVLVECIDTESYVIYPLQEDQVLKTPWLDNTLLLIINTKDSIPNDVYKAFVVYLKKGGKILSLSSSFTLGNAKVRSKSELKDSIQALVFTKGDSTEITLDVLTSGNVFENLNGGSGDEAKTWGYLKNSDKDPMIIRHSHGDNGGEAILCQAQLEISPNSTAVKTEEDFNCLKLSNARRCEVLVQILKSLGIRCELSNPPALTPLYLLAKSDDIQVSFLQWLWNKLPTDGLIKSSKISLKVVRCYQSEMEISPTLEQLVTEAGDFSSDHFSLEVYRQNLHTKKLGQIVLFAEVTTTTMNLLDGLLIDLPQEMGLIAIAARQSQGKGRGGNAWLSPLGCAMFTLHISIPLTSQLGQRIAFIQHLVSMAVVESVKSIPGYEDIDLRVKWPNDIYYSDVMKVGGVLVNSTLMGSTFHILIGCGFNVANRNPTICINDLIDEHNKKADDKLKLLNTDYLIARTVTKLEGLIDIFQDKGPNGVLPLYYQHWIHSGKQVRLGHESGPLAWIVGVDDSGFLQVLPEGQDVVTVHPDGNSFDMMKNLIIPKHQ
ncbi:biotin--protein ligase isoform X2 [Ambystoma mexicanum]|uniref:biotin--protein ligase isoform X2 n=1 Tax=Ambystoma mexicanum TaxID=8296 RepID=UPI0037E95BCB